MQIVYIFQIVAIVCTLLQLAHAIIEDLDLPESTHNISSVLCIIKFCEKYFRSTKRVIGSLVIVNSQNASEFHTQLIIMLNNNVNYEMGVMVKDANFKHGSTVHVVDKAKNYFVVFDRTSEVTDAINQWHRLPTWNPLAQVVALFINTYEDDEMNEQMLLISREFVHRRMINVIILSYRYDTNIVQSHTFYPYDEDICADNVAQLHLIEECEYYDDQPYDPNMRTINELKPKIPGNLHGCDLRIASSTLEPFVFYNEQSGTYDIGTEVLMVRTIAQALKMTPVFIRINETRENRVVSNESGIYSTLLTEKADILIGGMDRDARVQKLLWISIPYIQDDQTWCVATARPQELWRNIFGIYTLATWFILIGVIFFIAFVIYLFIGIENRVENYVWTLMIGMAASIGQYACYEPQRASIRVMMVFFFLYGLIMSSSFNSFLISILTEPRYKQQIDNVELALQENVHFAGGEVALSHYPGTESLGEAVRRTFDMCLNTDACMARLAFDEKLAVAVSRLHALNTLVISQSQIFCFPRTKNIYSYSVAMPIRMDFHLLPVINYNIRQLFEFGLIERWNKLSQSIAANEEIKKSLAMASEGKDSHLVVLTVAHIMGALLIMSFGHLLAIIAFAIEQLVHWQMCRRDSFKAWYLLHRFMEPK